MALSLSRWLARPFVWLVPFLCTAPLALAEDMVGVDDPIRAGNNYMLNCRGCHGPNGNGSPVSDVPNMRGFIGNFLKVEGGREFLVQVPGSANTPLSDDALAELLNWMLSVMSGPELPADFTPYGAGEVSALRKTPEADVIGRRAALIEAMRERGIHTE